MGSSQRMKDFLREHAKTLLYCATIIVCTAMVLQAFRYIPKGEGRIDRWTGRFTHRDDFR